MVDSQFSHVNITVADHGMAMVFKKKISVILYLFFMLRICFDLFVPSVHNTWLLSCQPIVKVTSCFVYKVIRDLKSIDHLCINPIHRIGLIHK